MSKTRKIVSAVVIVILAAIVAAAFMLKGDAGFAGTAWAILPPIIAIALALVTREVYSSLFVGIVVGAFMYAGSTATAGSVFTSGMNAIVNDGIISAVSGTAGIFVFLVILGVVVALMNKAGGSAAFGRWAQKHIKSKLGASIATFLLGVLIFIDDYFNCLTVGSVMRPVTDGHKISRAKLAYLIDATAAPVCMIAPISSWAAAVSEYAEGTEMSGIQLFIRAIPYNFYSLLTLVFIVAISIMKFDYGSMKKFEIRAENGDLGIAANIKDDSSPNPKGRVIDLILPTVLLIISCLGGLLYVGGFFGNYDIVAAFEATDATVGLPWGSLIALILIIIYLIARRIINFKDAMECLPKGFIAMVPAILILTFATSLKNVTGLLELDTFVESALGNVGALQNFLPAIIFVVACILSFSTGTSWGTFGILIPIVISIFPATSELMYIGMSACLAGSVCGDHCSPISDTTIMSSAGAQCNHVDHVSTQIPYAITVAGVSFVSFIIAAFIQNAWVSLAISAIILIGVLFGIKLITKRRA